MTNDDKKFVRDWSEILSRAHYIHFEYGEFKRLLTLLIESEAMRKKVEFDREHSFSVQRNPSTTELVCLLCQSRYNVDFPRHGWNLDKWIEAERKEIEGERTT